MPFCAYCGTLVNAVSYVPCVSCGNPTNGAPKPAVSGGGGNAAVVIAIIVVVVLVAFAILGIMAAIAIPNLLTAMQRSKQKRTMADMRTVGVALDGYAEGNGKHYPDAISMEQLAQKLSPTYVTTPPVKDGWGNEMRYDCWSASGSGPCDSYVIVSAGKDARFEVEDPTKYRPRGPTTNFNDDIVFQNGSFTQYPEGFNVH